MIVQCAQCGTKYNLDDATVRPGETKVKCSRCQYVFTVPRPLTLDEARISGKAKTNEEDPFLQQWAKDFAPQSPPAPRQPATPPPAVAAPPPRAFIPPTAEEGQLEEEPLFGETASPEEEMPPFKAMTVKETSAKKGRAVSTTFLLSIFLLVIVIGSLYYWSKAGVSIPAFEYIYEKVYNLMEGEKAQKLFVLDRRGTEYLLAGGKVYVIQGKVANRSQETKRFVKLKSTLFDKAGKAVAISIGYCGITISNEEIKKSTYEGLKTSFGFIGASQAVPVPTQNSIPFTIIFFSPPDGATDYNVEIAETTTSD
jgi:predicted Zn finger-like uncharacterized protein